MTRHEFVFAAFLKYLERREVMDLVVNPLSATEEEREKLIEEVFRLSRFYTVIERCCEMADEEERRPGEPLMRGFTKGRQDLN